MVHAHCDIFSFTGLIQNRGVERVGEGLQQCYMLLI